MDNYERLTRHIDEMLEIVKHDSYILNRTRQDMFETMLLKMKDAIKEAYRK